MRHSISLINGFLVSCILLFNMTAFAVQLETDFSNGLQNWTGYGSPASKVVDVHGKTDVLNNMGDGWCSSGIISQMPIDVSNGVEISANVFL